MADFSCLLSLIDNMPAYTRLIRDVAQTNSRHRVIVPDAAKPFVISAFSSRITSPLFLVTPEPDNARQLYDEILVWCSEKTTVLFFPDLDTLPYEHLAPSRTLVQERLHVLSTLAEAASENRTTLNNTIVITSAPALMRKIISREKFSSASYELRVGMEAEPLKLLAGWVAMGYQREAAVEMPGMVSRRGGILDIYTPGNDLPARIEFFGNNIESIRFFDPVTQRSLKQIQSLVIAPPGDAFSGTTNSIDISDTLMDYLPENTIFLLNEPLNIENSARETEERIEHLRQRCREEEDFAEAEHRPYLTAAELMDSLNRTGTQVQFCRWDSGSETEQSYKLDFSMAPHYGGQLEPLLAGAREMAAGKRRLILITRQAKRMAELLGEEGLNVPVISQLNTLPRPGSLTLIDGALSAGWGTGRLNKTILLTDAELFGIVKPRRYPVRRKTAKPLSLSDFTLGDYVVHIEHGIGRFTGITKMPDDSIEREYLILEYAAGDKLYVPLDQLDRINRYVGAGEGEPVLTRLGTQDWSRLKRRVKESTEKMARDLLALYSERELATGHAYLPDTTWQNELEDSFPFTETPDQAEAVRQVKEDMEKPKCMDRLICGDVGYGKTEVILRAAFKAVMDSRQVAVLVPTTVLAQQHYMTFKQRLAPFPVKIDVLCRFNSRKEQQKILADMADGTVDICIGTHRLLQKDVKFKNLGLVIVDEEQRFGVADKEKLKKMRKEVDFLTASATPIPRTLHLSLAGARDISIMETPPENRLPIKTSVSEYDDKLVREVILREIERKGQVFFVHNRVHNINRITQHLTELIPEAKILVAHGQMANNELEEVMQKFAEGEADILVCTTIIESGLDIPRANTLIINEADSFGLAQLYQLRGRVGRSSEQAYAYFLYGKGRRLTSSAEKRLATIFEATDLGTGFQIAMKDLEIRGAGNLLGAEQSGHIAAVGFDLYCRLLAENVARLRAEREKKISEGNLEEETAPSSIMETHMPTINLPLNAHIPEDYIAGVDTRLNFYRRLASIKTPEEVDNVAAEMRDIFGRIPLEVENLLYAVKIKSLAAKASIRSISAEKEYIILWITENMDIRPSLVTRLRHGGGSWDGKSLMLRRKAGDNSWQKELEELLTELATGRA